MPLGFRAAISQVRNYELRLAKARDVLATQELEIAHELTTTFQNLAWRYKTAETNYNKWKQSEAQIARREERYTKGVSDVETSILLDQLLQNQRRAATAEVTFYTSVIEYNKSIADLHFRKGTLLEVNNVHIAEGAWTPEAYKDALRRAWARTFAFDSAEADPLCTEPPAFVREGYLGSVQLIEHPAPPPSSTSPAPYAPPAAPLLPEPSAPPGLQSKSGPLTLPGPAAEGNESPNAPPETAVPESPFE
jgi:hypothetical protein